MEIGVINRERNALDMKRSKEFKPCDQLTLADLEKHPVWTFNLERAEAEPEADETWVWPETFQKKPKNTDVLFLRAELRTAEGKMAPGALLVRFEGGKAETQALALLHPKYLALGLDGEKLVDWAKEALKKLQPKSSKWLPITYKAVMPVGSKEITFSGQAG
jgi:hypothetical protein